MKKCYLMFYGPTFLEPNTKIPHKILYFCKCSTPWANAVDEDLDGAYEVMVEKKLVQGLVTRDERSSRNGMKKNTKWSDEQKATFSATIKKILDIHKDWQVLNVILISLNNQKKIS